MSRVILLIAITQCVGLSGFTQETSEDPFQERIDDLWSLVYQNPDTVQILASELLRDANASNSYIGRLNALQLRAEAYYMNFSLDSAYKYYSQAMEIAISEADRNEIGHTHTSLASLSSEMGDRVTAIDHFQKSLQIRVDDKDTSEMCDVAVRYANCLGDADMPTQAMEKYLFGLRCCRAINDELTIGHAYNGMAIVHKKQRNFEKALELLDSAGYYYDRVQEEFFVASVLNNRGVVKKELGMYGEARTDYLKGLEVMESSGYDRGVMSFNQNLGILSNIQGEPELGMAYCGKAMAIARRIDIPMTLSEALNEIAKSQLKLGKLNDAVASIDEAIGIAAEIRSLEKEHQAWETKSLIHEAQGESELALSAYRRYVTLNDSMFQLDKTAEIDRLQTVYETEKKQRAIEHLEAEAELEQNRRKWLIIGLVSMGVAALALILNVIMKRRKDKQVHQAQLELKDSENLRLEEQLDHKRRELTEKALHLAQKNELLQGLKEELKSLRHSDVGHDILALSNKIRFDQQIDNNWEQFTMAFTETNSGFFDRLEEKHHGLSKSERRLSALLTMHLTSKEIGAILSISDEGVRKARYRLRKKLGLKTEDDLEQYLASI